MDLVNTRVSVRERDFVGDRTTSDGSFDYEYLDGVPTVRIGGCDCCAEDFPLARLTLAELRDVRLNLEGQLRVVDAAIDAAIASLS